MSETASAGVQPRPAAEPATVAQAATAEPPHSWSAVIDQLRQVHDDPAFQDNHPDLARRLQALLTESVSRAVLDDSWFRHRVAYIVADIDRGSYRIALPPEIRSELNDKAVSSPGLGHRELVELLHYTAELGHDGVQLAQRVRHQARLYVENGVIPADRLSQLQSEMIAQLAGPQAPLPAEVPPDMVSQVDPAASVDPLPRARQATGEARPEASQPAPGGAEEQPAPRVAGQVASRMPAGTAMMDTLAPPATPAAPPPWQRAPQALANRLANYRVAQADLRTRNLQRQTEVSADAAIRALAALGSGPAADLMRQVKVAAANDPNGVAGVIAQMRPGGTQERLRTDYNAAIVQNPSVSEAFNRARAAVGRYLATRDALVRDSERRGWNSDDVDRQLAARDRAVIQGAAQVPGRQSGQSLVDELAGRAVEMARDLIERVKQLTQRTVVGPAAAPTAAPSATVAPG